MTVSQSEDATVPAPARPYVDATFSADSSRLYAVSGNTVYIIDTVTGAEIAHYSFGNALGAIDLSPDGNYLAVVEKQPSGGTGTLYRLDVTTGNVSTFQFAGTSTLYDVGYLADGRVIVSQQASAPLGVINLATGDYFQATSSLPGRAVINVSADGTYVLAVPHSSFQPLYTYDLTDGTGRVLVQIPDPYAGAGLPPPHSGVGAVSPSGDLIVDSMNLKIFDATLNTVVGTLAEKFGYLAQQCGMAFSSDGTFLYLLVADGKIVKFSTATWDVVAVYESGAPAALPLDQIAGTVTGYGDILSISPDGLHASVIGRNGIQIVDLATAVPVAGPGDDVLSGSGVLLGFGGNDVLTGNGSSRMYGGEGDDTYYVTSFYEYVSELANQGHDTIHSTVSYQLLANQEDLVLLDGVEADYGGGNELDNSLTGNSVANTLIGGGGNDWIDGGDGHDDLDGGNGNDTINGGAGTDTASYRNAANGVNVSLAIAGVQDTGQGFDTLVGIEQLVGSAHDDVLTGDSEDNHLEGMQGNDQLYGAGGNDYLSDVEGNDRLDGGDGDDLLEAGVGDDVLIGGAGADRMLGGAGSDIYYVDNIGDEVSEASFWGRDSVFASVDFTLGANVEDLTLEGAATSGAGNELDNSVYGNGGANQLYGLGGNDLLDGMGGADKMFGGAGNDTYYVNNLGDEAIEGINEGRDSVFASVNFTLGANVEDLTLQGAATSGTGNELDNDIAGNARDNSLSGGGGHDDLYGFAGNDLLNGGDGNDNLFGHEGADVMSGGAGDDFFVGGSGNDTLQGGLGNDQYQIDADGSTDTIIEEVDGGYDFVFSDINYALPQNVEYLRLFGSGALTGYGNDLDNSLVGNEFANSLFGLSGNDWLNGFAGDDILSGGDGADQFSGGGGADVIIGGAGQDTLKGDAGNDTFLDTAAGLNGDTITDFSFGDKIVIEDANLASFSFSLSGNTLNYSGGSLTLTAIPAGRIVAHAAQGGGVELTVVVRDADNDFNGDGRSDVLWRNDAGQFQQWQAQPNGGFATNPNASGAVPTSWFIAGTGDYNGDGRDDILWRSSAGDFQEWLGQANGGFAGNPNASGMAPTNWSIAGSGDFNGDGRDDILWRSTTGDFQEWLGQANGGFVGNPNASGFVPTNYRVTGIGDFNGDGRDDILWRGTTGDFQQWLGQPNGGFANNPFASGAAPTNWQVVGAGDFNGDGRDDILWRSSAGDFQEWLGQPNGGFAGNPNASGTVPISWEIDAIGDFNGDGRDDILWRSAAGDFQEWLAQDNGSFAGNHNAAGFVAISWHVQSPNIYF